VSKIIIVPYSERKHQARRERRNVFSDETNLYLLRLLRGDSTETHKGANAASHDLQLELAAAIRKRVLPWFWSISLHVALLILLALHLLPSIRFEPIEILSGIANIPVQQNEPFHVPGIANGNAPSVIEDIQEGARQAEEPTIPKVQIHSSPGLNFAGRDPSLRVEMLGGGGGSGQTDEAVLAVLRWLVRVQQPNGAWHFS
jgi:hypothetical protein